MAHPTLVQHTLNRNHSERYLTEVIFWYTTTTHNLKINLDNVEHALPEYLSSQLFLFLLYICLWKLLDNSLEKVMPSQEAIFDFWFGSHSWRLEAATQRFEVEIRLKSFYLIYPNIFLLDNLNLYLLSKGLKLSSKAAINTFLFSPVFISFNSFLQITLIND